MTHKLTFQQLQDMVEGKADIIALQGHNDKWGYTISAPRPQGGWAKVYASGDVYPSQQYALQAGAECLDNLQHVPLDKVLERVVAPKVRHAEHWLAASRPGVAIAAAIATVNIWPILGQMWSNK
jgi:hypothetical protein